MLRSFINVALLAGVAVAGAATPIALSAAAPAQVQAQAGVASTSAFIKVVNAYRYEVRVNGETAKAKAQLASAQALLPAAKAEMRAQAIAARKLGPTVFNAAAEARVVRTAGTLAAQQLAATGGAYAQALNGERALDGMLADAARPQGGSTLAELAKGLIGETPAQAMRNESKWCMFGIWILSAGYGADAAYALC